MQQVRKYEIEESELKNNLIRIGDIINMDGPILTLFSDKKDLYLFDWVDNDERLNRWLIYKLNKVDIISFLQKNISYKSLFEKYQTMYYADIDANEFDQYKIYKLIEIPTEYRPDKDLFFDYSCSTNLDKIFKSVGI